MFMKIENNIQNFVFIRICLVKAGSGSELTKSCSRIQKMLILIRSVAEPVLFGRSRSRCEGPAPGSGSTLDKTEEILNDILFVCSNIDLIKKQKITSK